MQSYMWGHLKGENLVGGPVESHSLTIQDYRLGALSEEGGQSCNQIRIFAGVVLAVPAIDGDISGLQTRARFFRRC